MADRNDIINQIIDLTNCTREEAAAAFDAMRADGRIYFDDAVALDLQGLAIRADVDLIQAVADAN